METQTYQVDGLTCLDCADRLSEAVQRVKGVASCTVDLATSTLTVESERRKPVTGSLDRAITSAGFSLRADIEAAPPGFVRFTLARRDGRLTVAAALLALGGLALWLTGAPPLVHVAPVALAIPIGGLPIALYAWQEIRFRRTLGINALMTIAVIGAVAIGEWAEAAIVVILFSIGETMEGSPPSRIRVLVEAVGPLVRWVRWKPTSRSKMGLKRISRSSISFRATQMTGTAMMVDGGPTITTGGGCHRARVRLGPCLR